MSPYAAHNTFVTPARAYPHIWRLIVGLVLSVAVYVGFLFVVRFIAGFAGLEVFGLPLAQTPATTLILLFSFIGMGLGTALAARALHKRRFHTLIGAQSQATNDFIRAAGVSIAVYAIFFAVMALLGQSAPITPNINLGLWVILLPLSFLGIFVQTGAEELLFRGYLQQQLAARFSTPLVWMILPSALFALGHYDAVTFGKSAWLLVAATALFGILAADLTARTGTIGAAWGLHFANNCFAILFVAMEGPLSGLGLYITPFEPNNTGYNTILIVLDMGAMILTWLAIRALIVRAKTP